jgi:hypothetical protein
MRTLSNFTLACAREAVATKQEDGTAGALVQNDAGIGLAKTSQTTQLAIGILLAQLGQLVSKGLEPRRLGLENGTTLG